MTSQIIMAKKKVERVPRKCIPSEPCSRETSIGEFHGKECALGDELYHRTDVESFEAIAKDGALKVAKGQEGVWKNPSISLSSCELHDFGGEVKLVFDTSQIKKNVQFPRSMCYVSNSDMDAVLDMDLDAHKKGGNTVAADLGLNRQTYADECEYMVDSNLPLKGNLKRVEYWIPWKPGSQTSCRRVSPKYVIGNEFDFKRKQRMIESIAEDMQKVKSIAEKMGAEFAVRSCFRLASTSFSGYEKIDKNFIKHLLEADITKGEDSGGVKRGSYMRSKKVESLEKCLC